MYKTYILKSLINGRYYVGSCRNIDERLRLHNTGQVFSTKPYLPWQLVYIEEFDNLSKARRRESQIKRWKSRLAVTRLIMGA